MEKTDVKDNAGQSSGSEENLDDKTQKGAGQGSDKPEGDKSGSEETRSIPYARFKQVNDELQEARKIRDWYRENIGDPNDVVAYRKWQQEVSEKAKEDEGKGQLTPAQLARFRQVMKLADPQYAEFMERQQHQHQEDAEIQIDDATEQITELCAQADIKDEDTVARIAVHVMDEIKADPKLMRKWQRGDLSCIDKAYNRYMTEFIDKFRGKANGKGDKDLSDVKNLRKISRLPSFPQGGSAGTSAPPKRKEGDKGLTKQAGEDAWAVLQSVLRE